MFVFCLMAVFFVGITRKTDGSLTFTEVPRSPVYVKEGRNAVLIWKYYENQKPAELNFITWGVYVEVQKSFKDMIVEYADGRVVNHPDLPAPYANRVEKKDQATLVIKNVTFEDSNSFRCVLTSDTGAVKEKRARLSVTGPASCKPEIQLVKEGDSATITCNATGVPSENRTCTGPGLSEEKANCSQFTIKEISVSDAGFYNCDATVNNDINVATCFVQVRFPPKQDNRTCIERLFCARMNKSLSICCPVRGYPPPRVTWEKNGIQLPQENNAVLTITSVKDKDLGNYTCTATHGETTIGPFIITVTDCKYIPDFVDDLSVSVISGTSEKPAKLEVQPHAHAENYVVKIEGEGIMTDFLTGTQPSLEVHYHTLVMEETGEKPPEINICVDVSAMNDKRVLAKTPTCQKLTIKKPSDTDI